MISLQVLSAFVAELEKVAAGPKVIEDPSLLPRGLAGLHVRRKTLDAHLHHPAIVEELARHGFQPGQDALYVPPAHQLQQLFGEHGPIAGKVVRRHEMTHWLRGRQGKLEGFGEPGLPNVLRTAREELAAHLSSLRTKGLSHARRGNLILGTPKGVIGSVKAAYPGGVWNAIKRVV